MIKLVVSKAILIALVIFTLGMYGAAAYIQLPRESNPDISIPVVLVTTPYVGVAPEDIEGLITTPLENELAGLRDVKQMGSTSSEGVSTVSIEFEPSVNIDDALQKVRDRVNRAKPDLPDDAEEPIIREINFSDIPVIIVTIAGDAGEAQLKFFGEKLQDEVERIPGVLDAKLSGGTDREIKVLIDPSRLEHYGLSFGDVIGAIQNENQSIPGGTLRVGDGNVLLRVPGEFVLPREIEDVAVKRVGDRPVYVRDLGRVEDSIADRTSYARMNGQAAVSISVTKRVGANIVEVCDEVNRIATAHAADWPEGVYHEALADQSVGIRDMVNELQNNIFTALLLVVTVIIFSMGGRNSLFVAFAIPMSMLISFMVLSTLGFTLNMVVLFSLIIALGMLVDNAIVVIENVFRHLEMGKSRTRAAIDGTNEVATAVAASTLTTVAAFFPLVFWGGIMGEFMSYLPKTLIIVLIASLFVAIVLLPVVASRFMKMPAAGQIKGEDYDEDLEDEPEYSRATLAYRSLLNYSIRWRWLSVVGFAGLFIATLGIYSVFNYGTELFPEVDPNRATVSITLPDGTDLDTTDQILRQVEAVLAQAPNVDIFVAETGVAGTNVLIGGSATPHAGRITVDFLPHATAAKEGQTPRVGSTEVTIAQLRASLLQISGAEINVAKENMGPPVDPDIQVLISGEDFHEVGQLAQLVKRQIAAVDGVTEIADDYRVNRPELALRIDRGAAARVGVSTGQIGNTLRTAVAGAKATTLREGEDEYDVVVQLAPEFSDNVQDILSMTVPGREDTSPDTYAVPLSSVASYELAGGTGSIQHIDQDLVVTITADVPETHNTAEVQAAVAALIADYDMPKGFHATLKGSNEQMQETIDFLSWAMFTACALILLVLVAQFDSSNEPGSMAFDGVAMPVIIMCTVALSLVGVLWGLLLTGTPFGVMMTGIGVISLAGVVVNNAIVLLDYVKQLRMKGLNSRDALVRAGTTRFRPVMLTATTTVLGLVPMALAFSLELSMQWAGPVPYPWLRLMIGSQSNSFWGPMAIAIIFGLSFATVLTLIMVPTFYSVYEDIYRAGKWLMNKVFSQRDDPEATVPSVPTAAVDAAKLLLVGALGALALSGPAQALTLDDAQIAAQEGNLELRIQRERTYQAENQTLRAWSIITPTVSADLGYTLNQREIAFDMGDSLGGINDLLEGLGQPPIDFGPPMVIQQKQFWQANLNVQQTLFDGAAYPLLRGAYKNVNAARLDEQRADQEIRSQAARVFYRLLAAQRLVDIRLENLGITERQLELVENRVAAGLAPRRDKLQAQLRVSQANRDHKTAIEILVQSQVAFTQVTGLSSDQELEMPALLHPPQSLDEARALSTERRFDLHAAEERIMLAKLETRSYSYGWLPRVTGNFYYLWNQNTGFNDQEFNWMVSINANWRLWDGGVRLADIRQAQSQRRVAELSEARIRRDATVDITNSWESYQRSRSNVVAAEAEVALADESYELAETAYQAGTGTFIEVEEAQLGLQQSRLSLLQEQLNHETAAMELMVAAGIY